MRKNRRNIPKTNRVSYLSDRLRIPPEVLGGDCRITIAGNEWMWIEKYQGIFKYTRNSLTLLGKRGKIKIEGTDLKMDYYTKEDLVIRGNIISVRYDKGKDSVDQSE